MPLEIISYTAEWSPAVRAFNARLIAGGLDDDLKFPEEPRSEYSTDPAEPLHQEFFLAVDEGAVRGGYFLTHEPWTFQGQPCRVSNYRLPLSEGLINRAYSSVGPAVIRHSLKRSPYVYCLGMGNYDRPFPRTLAAMKWPMFTSPFFFRAVNPARVLRNLRSVRQNPQKRLAFDIAALTGAATIGLGLLQSLKTQPAPRLKADLAPTFGPWADETFSQLKTVYPLLAVRDSRILAIRYPESDARFLRLRLPSGWAVLLDTQMENHRHFGDLRVGTIVDIFGPPADARSMVQAATRFLADRGVDIIISNQTHQAWIEAFAQSGYLSGPSNRIFAGSPKLIAEKISPFETAQKTLHLTRGDAAGPIHL